MTDYDDEKYLEELYAIVNAAKKVKTGEDFIEFLDILDKEIRKDNEAEERLQLEFIDVISSKLKFQIKFPDSAHHVIEMPKDPDWNWLARLFLTGALEN
jgi:hypothetical protein